MIRGLLVVFKGDFNVCEGCKVIRMYYWLNLWNFFFFGDLFNNRLFFYFSKLLEVVDKRVYSFII